MCSVATVAFVRTLLGPDHYLPFVSMARSRGWSIANTVRITLLCGVGHIVGSIILRFIGVFIGSQLGSLGWVEDVIGSLAARVLFASDLVFLVWGGASCLQKQGYILTVIFIAVYHRHQHTLYESHTHDHTSKTADGSVGPWTIFVVFDL